MWEKMLSASLLVAGAAVLFTVFTVILFVYERQEDRKARRAYKPGSLLRYAKNRAFFERF